MENFLSMMKFMTQIYATVFDRACLTFNLKAMMIKWSYSKLEHHRILHEMRLFPHPSLPMLEKKGKSLIILYCTWFAVHSFLIAFWQDSISEMSP